MNDEARIYAKVLPSKRRGWTIEESDSLVHQNLDVSAANGRAKNGMAYQTWIINPESKPLLKIGAPDEH